MPCFKGFAVSIHTPDGPLAEYSIQKQTKASRITTYIPVPTPKLNRTTSMPEPASFAISITLLTPGLAVPYTKPAPSIQDPNPQPKYTGGLNNAFGPAIPPYHAMTHSPNETVAAYIHFDGRAKEEVATLLRRGVETWVNSRWVSVPESAGGGLAEREFLFREVGLERWLNGLDLQGQNKDAAAARIQKRKERLERRQKKLSKIKKEDSSDDEGESSTRTRARPVEKLDVLRYGESKEQPVEELAGSDDLFDSDSSEDDMPEPEAAGQIKISLFRVLASGDIKKGEYSPQFDMHDDDESMQDTNNDDGDGNVDHTTGLAKAKTLDPSTISTQTVTGIDPPDKPFATFTFLYRGEKQLRKMGVLAPLPPSAQKTSTATKRNSRQLDFKSVKPLESTKGTVGYTSYRDAETSATSTFDVNGNGKKVKSKSPDNMDSDDEDDDRKRKAPAIDNDGDEETETKQPITKEEAARVRALADGVGKVQLKKRGHDDENTFEPVINDSSDDNECAPAAAYNGSASSPPKFSSSLTPPKWGDSKSDPADSSSTRATKKHRASTAGHDVDVVKSSGFLPTPVTTNGPSLIPATPSINGISPAKDGPGDVLLNGLLGGTAAPGSKPIDSAVVNGAQKEWEEQARKQPDVTAFVGGDNGQASMQNVAAQTALPDKDMDDEL